MDIAEFKKLKPEDMPQKIKQLTATLSVPKNMPRYSLYLKIYLAESFEFLSPYQKEVEIQPKYNEKLAIFKDLLSFMVSRNLYVNEIEKSSTKYYTKNDKSSLTAMIINFYPHYISQSKHKNNETIIDILTILKNMGDEVKPKELSFHISNFMNHDRYNSRKIDPIFNHLLELYGFDIINTKEVAYSSWQTKRTTALQQALTENSQPYFEAIENAAIVQDKVPAFETLLKKEISALPDIENTLISKIVEKLDIAKEQKHFKTTLKNYNKKEIKKRAKEQKQPIVLNQSEIPSIAKKSKFKL